MKPSRNPFTIRMAAVALLVALVAALGALPVGAVPTCTTDCYVSPTGNDGNDGATAATPLLTIQVAVNAVNAGGTVHLAAGTYTQDTLLNKSLILDGSGPATTFIDPASIGLDISADNVTVKDVALINAAIHGARIQKSPTPSVVANTTFDNVYFTTNTSRGLEIGTSANDVTITNCVFDGNRTGIRSSSTAVVDGLHVTGSTFKNHTDASSGIGIYQASEGNPGNMRDVNVDSSTFDNNGFAGIYGEEMRDMLVENSTFSNEMRGFLLFDFYTGSATATGPITFQNNTFTDHKAAALQLQINANALGAPITIDNNSFDQDAAVVNANWAQIDVRLNTGFTHAAVNITNNDMVFSGVYGGGATAVYGIKLRGGPDVVTIDDNTIDGGGIGNNGGTPATAGLFVVTNAGTYGAMKAATQITGAGNAFTGFENGVVVYDEVGAVYGAMPVGALLSINRSDLSDNSAYGFRSGPGEDANATCNWWGAADGPGPVGPGSGSNVTTDVAYAPWLVTDELDGPCFVDGVYVSTVSAGTTADNLAFGPHDILKWDGTAWSKWFDGSAAHLMPSGRAVHNINSVWIPDTSGDDAVFSFVQNARVVPGVPGKVNGMDLVWWNGSSFSLWFDGEDVGLTNKTQEKIDAVHVLDGSESPIGGSCIAYLLISTQGDGQVPNHSGGTIKFDGTDVLGFCMTNSGSNTAGLWHRVLNGKAEGMPGQALTSLSASDDGETLYLTTRSTFNVDSASGSHSMIYRYQFATGEFSGPYFSAPANGLPRQVDALHVEGELP